jgi:hypothetical protein
MVDKHDQEMGLIMKSRKFHCQFQLQLLSGRLNSIFGMIMVLFNYHHYGHRVVYDVEIALFKPKYPVLVLRVVYGDGTS